MSDPAREEYEQMPEARQRAISRARQADIQVEIIKPPSKAVPLHVEPAVVEDDDNDDEE